MSTETKTFWGICRCSIWPLVEGSINKCKKCNQIPEKVSVDFRINNQSVGFLNASEYTVTKAQAALVYKSLHHKDPDNINQVN